MVSPQTQSRQNKIEGIKKIGSLAMDLLTISKTDLNRIDYRSIKKCVATLESWKPIPKPTTKFSDYSPVMGMRPDQDIERSKVLKNVKEDADW